MVESVFVELLELGAVLVLDESSDEECVLGDVEWVEVGVVGVEVLVVSVSVGGGDL